MNNYYFTLTKPQQQSLSKKPGYIKVISECRQLAIEAFNEINPGGYSGVFSESKFNPSPNFIELETITQVIRSQNNQSF